MARDLVESLQRGYAFGEGMRETERKNKLRELLKSGMVPYEETIPARPQYGVTKAGEPLPEIPAETQTRYKFDYPNTIATLMQGEFGEEGLALQKQYEENELNRILRNTQLAKALEEKEKGGGLYGGIRTFIDDKGNVVEVSYDERTRQPVVMPVPSGMRPTIPMTIQPMLGPSGPGFGAIPSRGVPGGTSFQPSVVPGMKPMPTTAEAEQVASQELSADILGRMQSLVSSGKVKTGIYEGNKIRAKVKTGMDLTPEEADLVSSEGQAEVILLDAMRGAQVGPSEQKLFRQQLPRIDQNPALFNANVKNTLNNINFLRKRKAQMRPTPGGITTPIEQPPKPVKPATGGIKFLGFE